MSPSQKGSSRTRINFLPKAPRRKSSDSLLSLPGDDSTPSAPASVTSHGSTPPAGSRRDRDSLAVFKNCNSLLSLQREDTSAPRRIGLAPVQNNGLTTQPGDNRPPRGGSLASFQTSVPKTTRVVEESKEDEEVFNPFEYFLLWYAIKGIGRAWKWCATTVEGRRGTKSSGQKRPQESIPELGTATES